MAVVFFIASFLNDDVVSGSAGKVLARFFAATLLIAGLFMFALGYGLLRDERGGLDHYAFPIGLGIVVGAVESFFFLETMEKLLIVPLLFLLLAGRPVRRLFSRWFTGGSQRRAS
jgi:hypothetical protein